MLAVVHLQPCAFMRSRCKYCLWQGDFWGCMQLMGLSLQASVRLALSKSHPNQLPDITDQTPYANRIRTLYNEYVADLGGHGTGLSQAQLALIRRCAFLTAEIERLEAVFARKGYAGPTQLYDHLRVTGTLRRLFETLGIHSGRKARNITPTVEEYLKHGNGRTIDHEVDE